MSQKLRDKDIENQLYSSNESGSDIESDKNSNYNAIQKEKRYKKRAITKRKSSNDGSSLSKQLKTKENIAKDSADQPTTSNRSTEVRSSVGSRIQTPQTVKKHHKSNEFPGKKLSLQKTWLMTTSSGKTKDENSSRSSSDEESDIVSRRRNKISCNTDVKQFDRRKNNFIWKQSTCKINRVWRIEAESYENEQISSKNVVSCSSDSENELDVESKRRAILKFIFGDYKETCFNSRSTTGMHVGNKEIANVLEKEGQICTDILTVDKQKKTNETIIQTPFECKSNTCKKVVHINKPALNNKTCENKVITNKTKHEDNYCSSRRENEINISNISACRDDSLKGKVRPGKSDFTNRTSKTEVVPTPKTDINILKRSHLSTTFVRENSTIEEDIFISKVESNVYAQKSNKKLKSQRYSENVNKLEELERTSENHTKFINTNEPDIKSKRKNAISFVFADHKNINQTSTRSESSNSQAEKHTQILLKESGNLDPTVNTHVYKLSSKKFEKLNYIKNKKTAKDEPSCKINLGYNKMISDTSKCKTNAWKIIKLSNISGLNKGETCHTKVRPDLMSSSSSIENELDIKSRSNDQSYQFSNRKSSSCSESSITDIEKDLQLCKHKISTCLDKLKNTTNKRKKTCVLNKSRCKANTSKSNVRAHKNEVISNTSKDKANAWKNVNLLDMSGFKIKNTENNKLPERPKSKSWKSRNLSEISFSDSSNDEKEKCASKLKSNIDGYKVKVLTDEINSDASACDIEFWGNKSNTKPSLNIVVKKITSNNDLSGGQSHSFKGAVGKLDKLDGHCY